MRAASAGARQPQPRDARRGGRAAAGARRAQGTAAPLTSLRGGAGGRVLRRREDARRREAAAAVCASQPPPLTQSPARLRAPGATLEAGQGGATRRRRLLRSHDHAPVWPPSPHLLPALAREGGGLGAGARGGPGQSPRRREAVEPGPARPVRRAAPAGGRQAGREDRASPGPAATPWGLPAALPPRSPGRVQVRAAPGPRALPSARGGDL